MTYKLDLEEQDSSTDLIDSCIYNIVDGDELQIEPVNATANTNSETTVCIDENETMVVEIINNDKTESEVISKKLNGSLNNNQSSNTNSVSMKIFLNYREFFVLN